MKPCLHRDSRIRVLPEGGGAIQSIPISEYTPRCYLENRFDRMFTQQKMLHMERREDILYSATVGEETLAGSKDLLVAGLYADHSALSAIPKPFITVSVNLANIASRRRIRVNLHYDNDESIADLGLKTLFPKQPRFRYNRSKSYYFIWEVEDFLSRIAKLSAYIPVIAGIDNVWVSEGARDATNLGRLNEFIPVVPVAPLKGREAETTLKYVVCCSSGFGSPTLHRVDELQDESGVFDFYFPESPVQQRYSKSPSRACFTANGFLVFRQISGCDPYEFAYYMREPGQGGQADGPQARS